MWMHHFQLHLSFWFGGRFFRPLKCYGSLKCLSSNKLNCSIFYSCRVFFIFFVCIRGKSLQEGGSGGVMLLQEFKCHLKE